MSQRLPTGPLPVDNIEFFDPVEPGFWQRAKYPLRWLFLVSLVIVGIIIFRRYELSQYVDEKALRSLLEPFGVWSPLVFIGLAALSMCLMVIPYYGVMAVGALLFGVGWGALWSVLGLSAGATLVYLFCRWFGKGIREKKAQEPKWVSLTQRLEQDGFFYLFLLRLLPIIPFNLLNLFAAFAGIRVHHFIFANILGLIPPALVVGMATVLLLDPSAPRWQILLLVGVIACVVLPPVLFRQSRKQKQKERQKLLGR